VPRRAGGEPSRLPTPLTSLVGREREIAALGAVLRGTQGVPAVRLVTLTGPGGVGKTRLALRVAADLAAEGRFADGAVFVDLAAVRDPDLVAPAIVQTLGVRAVGQQPAVAMLKTFLAKRQILLILDNFEQIIEAGPIVTDLLQACPHLNVIVTSRSLLNVAGEQAIPVPPLSLPSRGVWDSGSREEGRSLLDSEAVRLFVERVRAVNPGFALAKANVGVVADIVQRLDGLPLAIELAAARSGLFSPAVLLARLDHRLPHLTGGPRDQPARHQTMRAAIAWSYDLLAPEEQQVFRSLSAFAGGFTLEAAEAVCSVADVLGAIESLTRQSLLRVVEPAAGGVASDVPRLTMLETVREFAAEQLAARGERGPGQRHAGYFLALAERAEPTYWGDASGDWGAEIVAESRNLRAALTWAAEQGETDTALRLASAMFDPHRMTGDNAREQERWAQRALAMPGGSPDHRGQALTSAAWLAFAHFDFAEGQALIEEALALDRQLGDELWFAMASFVLGNAAFHQGELAESRRHLGEALAGFRALDARGRAAWVLCVLASLDSRVAVDEGGDPAELARAIACYEEALALFREVDHRGQGYVRALHGLAYVAYKQRVLPRALAATQEVLALDWADGWPVYHYLEDVADIAGRIGRPEVAARLYGAAEAQRERDGRPVEPVYRAEFERDAAVSRWALGEAAFAAAWAAGRALPLEQAVAEALSLTAPAPPEFALTRRERQILPLLAAGRADREIADALFLGLRTVENHVARLTAKLDVHSRQEAVAVARAAGLLAASEAPPTETG
jgi:non-specific serine/threonine protein kinase